MKLDRLDIIGYLDDSLVEKAGMTDTGKKKHGWIKVVGIAACLCLVTTISMAAWLFFNHSSEPERGQKVASDISTESDVQKISEEDSSETDTQTVAAADSVEEDTQSDKIDGTIQESDTPKTDNHIMNQPEKISQSDSSEKSSSQTTGKEDTASNEVSDNSQAGGNESGNSTTQTTEKQDTSSNEESDHPQPGSSESGSSTNSGCDGDYQEKVEIWFNGNRYLPAGITDLEKYGWIDENMNLTKPEEENLGNYLGVTESSYSDMDGLAVYSVASETGSDLCIIEFPGQVYEYYIRSNY